jgi:hypothetical protein
MVVKVIDIESNGLLEDMLDYSSFPYKLNSEARLWVVSIKDVNSGEVFSAVKEQITKEWIKDKLSDADVVVLHNGVKFDLLALKLFGVLDYEINFFDVNTIFGKEVKIVDTLILSRLLNPDRHLGHSLSEWGKRLNFFKIDFRKRLVEEGFLDKNSPKGAEFKTFHPYMVEYCEQDTHVTEKVFQSLVEEMGDYGGWKKPLKLETKLADLAVRRENLGFDFDKDFAVKLVEEIGDKMEVLRERVNKILPPKPMNKSDLDYYTPPQTQFSNSEIKRTTPPKNQLKKDGTLSSAIINFAEKLGADITADNLLVFEGKEYPLPITEPLINYEVPSTHLIKFAERVGAEIVGDKIVFEGKEYNLPFNEPLKHFTDPDISNLDHVKNTLINDYGWQPTEWTVRDFTKNSKKQLISYEKRVIAFERWLQETLSGNYTKGRLEIAFEEYKVKYQFQANKSIEDLREQVLKKLEKDFPVRLPTTPKVRVGIKKELCENLIKLGDSVSFAKDFADYLTLKHRKSSIAGGDIEDMDFDEEAPNTGFLSIYREVDGRIPTASIEIGAASHRYTHIGVANIPKVDSIYGSEMRSLFRSGVGAVFYGFDFSAIEARFMAHFIHDYEEGIEIGKSFTAEKPLDTHTVLSVKMGISRDNAKQLNYALIFGAAWSKIKKMFGVSDERAKEIVNDFWNNLKPLKQFKDDVLSYWEDTGKKFVPAIDGRKLLVRSPHSILNVCFQSSAVIYAKYVTVMLMERLEKVHGLCIDPFKGKPDACSMIEYHDEMDMYTNPKLFKFETFKEEEEAKEFVKNWQGEQLSAIGHSDKGYFVCLPNVISKETTNVMRQIEKDLNIKVPMGFEYMLGRNWKDCH